MGVTRFVAPGPLVAMHTPTPPGGLRVPGGRVARALLVPDQDVPDRSWSRAAGRRPAGRRRPGCRTPRRRRPARARTPAPARRWPGPGGARHGVHPRLGLRDPGCAVWAVPLGRAVWAGPAGPCSAGRRGFGVGVIGGARGVTVRRAGGQVPRAGHGGGRRRGAARWASGPAGPLRPVICSVIGWSPWLGKCGGIKNPLVPVGSRGERAVNWLGQLAARRPSTRICESFTDITLLRSANRNVNR